MHRKGRALSCFIETNSKFYFENTVGRKPLKKRKVKERYFVKKFDERIRIFLQIEATFRI